MISYKIDVLERQSLSEVKMGRGSPIKNHLKLTVSKWKSVLWSDESKFDILVEKHGRRVLRAKEEGDLPASYQRSIQKPASLMVWGCISAYGLAANMFWKAL